MGIIKKAIIKLDSINMDIIAKGLIALVITMKASIKTALIETDTINTASTKMGIIMQDMTRPVYTKTAEM
jgi:hypothetical protein